ncbi:hypothetical protein J4460_08390 [Candidatus Woesearchaeota archaeon]|nr:MAG: hypothetical protein QS99_C0012G0022 [archaeon GW2011_AR4]MBS3130656.1 hypothetical protein [Candidatus Woesearchaeota archaeon]HIH37949.1 hypothetical protein [Candidatus Woesearchaeota archaeon]HIH48642.1 hypothetical protein [Candidatus Woesearchaeota archaeon]HIJ03728.1 hypothetical protein [Candidatus Woesearchaeota archaeon]
MISRKDITDCLKLSAASVGILASLYIAAPYFDKIPDPFMLYGGDYEEVTRDGKTTIYHMLEGDFKVDVEGAITFRSNTSRH